MPHVFKALQLLDRDRFVSRATFCRELHIGEGAAKTLILHMKAGRMADSTRAGTFLTERGRKFTGVVLGTITGETAVKKSRIFSGRHNHAILIRNFARVIRTGLEQRDFAVRYGASAALTLIYGKGRFFFPGEEKDVLAGDKKTRKVLMGMCPQDNDVVIITSADDPFVAELSVKNAALCTVAAS